MSSCDDAEAGHHQDLAPLLVSRLEQLHVGWALNGVPSGLVAVCPVNCCQRSTATSQYVGLISMAVCCASGHFGCDDGGAGADKRVVDGLAGAGVVLDRALHALDGLLRAVAGFRLARLIDLPECRLRAITVPVCMLPSNGIPTWFVLCMVVTAPDNELLLGPDDQAAPSNRSGFQSGYRFACIQADSSRRRRHRQGTAATPPTSQSDYRFPPSRSPDRRSGNRLRASVRSANWRHNQRPMVDR